VERSEAPGITSIKNNKPAEQAIAEVRWSMSIFNPGLPKLHEIANRKIKNP